MLELKAGASTIVLVDRPDPNSAFAPRGLQSDSNLDHVALATAFVEAAAMRAWLGSKRGGIGQRVYAHRQSLYIRDPGGKLVELPVRS